MLVAFTGKRRILAGVLALLLILSCLPAPPAAAQDPGAAVERRYGVVRDGPLVQRLESVAGPMALQFPSRKFRFAVLDTSTVNAFALADGRVYVTRGLLETVGGPDELAFILGHEITHVMENHLMKQWGESLLTRLALAALSRYVLKAGVESTRTIVTVGGALAQSAYSKEDEYRADAGGLRAMAAAGYDPRAGAAFMESLRKRYGEGQAAIPVIGWIASHPATGLRLERLKNLAASLSPPARPALTWEEQKKAAEAATAPPPEPPPGVRTGGCDGCLPSQEETAEKEGHPQQAGSSPDGP